jgi:hypothetical protein
MNELWRPLGVAIAVAGAVVGLWLAVIPTAVATAGSWIENCGVPVLDLGPSDGGGSLCQQANSVRVQQGALTLIFGGMLGATIFGYGEYQRLERESREEDARRLDEARREAADRRAAREHLRAGTDHPV